MNSRQPTFPAAAAWAMAAALGLGMGTPSIGADASARSLAAQMRDCAAEPDGVRRLACYDKLSAGLAGGASANVTPIPAANPTAAPTSAPSAATPTTPGSSPNTAAATSDFGVDNGPLQAKQQKGKPQSLKAVVTGVSTRPDGQLAMTLDSGQVWVQLQPSYFPVKPGDAVEINVGAIGSYQMWIPSARRASKVTRVH
jgi:hypothetical protein